MLQKKIFSSYLVKEKYVPTRLWGKSGHVQSLVHTFKGRVGAIPEDKSDRYEILASDGSIVSYDIFEPDHAAMRLSDFSSSPMVLIVPGICNHAESRYIRAISFHLNAHGFRVAVYNHTGALKTVKLKRPRIFTYGYTDDLEEVVEHIRATQGVHKMVGLGISLGGNILMKYLGEKVPRQDFFHFAISVCQGYDISEASIMFRDWENFRWLYNYGMTRNVLKVINQHKDDLAGQLNAERPHAEINWKDLFSARELREVDANFTLKMCDMEDMEEFYKYNSSSQFMDRISLPMLIINANDDPIVPETLHKYPRKLLEVNKNALFLRVPHGGHLGFFEGGFVIPNRVTWLDRMLAEYIQVALNEIQRHDANNNNSRREVVHTLV